MPITAPRQLFAAAALSLATAATAAPVVDQFYDVATGADAGALSISPSASDQWSQTFTAGVDTLDWAAASLLGMTVTDTTRVVARIWDASNAANDGKTVTLGAAPLGISAPSVIAASYMSAALGEYPTVVPMTEFSFAAPIALAIGGRYLLDIVLTDATTPWASAIWRYGQTGFLGSAGYAGGGLGWLDPRDGKVYVEPGLDFAFATGRLGSDGNDPSAQPVPTPPTLALALLGLAALHGTRRARGRNAGLRP